MPVVVFIMTLLLANGSGPEPYTEQMGSVEACTAKVAKVTADFAKTDETFRFSAGCVLVVTKSRER